MPRHVAIIGMVPHVLENKLGLSAPAAVGLDEMVQMLVDELQAIGVEAKARNEIHSGHWRRQAELEAAACA
jgi:hydrogenase maturation protease